MDKRRIDYLTFEYYIPGIDYPYLGQVTFRYDYLEDGLPPRDYIVGRIRKDDREITDGMASMIIILPGVTHRTETLDP